jgi:hypothetical protein
MSVYNGARYLSEAVDSILAQTWRDFELVVIDDASTDRSRALLEAYRDPRLRLVANEKNLGLTRSLNLGLRLSRGELIARHDADDVSHPSRFEKQIRWFDDHPEGVLLGTQARTIDAAGRPAGRAGEPKPLTTLGVRWALLFFNPFVHSSVMFRRETILSLGGYDEAYYYNQDFELWSRVAGSFVCGNLADALVDYRAHAGSIAGQRGVEVLESRLANLELNKAVQRRNLLRETGSETLAAEWPEIWTSMNVGWLVDPPAAPGRALDLVEEMHGRFLERHPDARDIPEIESTRAAALLVVAAHTAQRARGVSLCAMSRALRADVAQSVRRLPWWMGLFLTSPALAARIRSRIRGKHLSQEGHG